MNRKTRKPPLRLEQSPGTELAVEKEKARALATLTELADGFVILDEAWRYVFVNAAAGRLLGKAPEELLGRVIWEVFPEAVHLPVYEYFQRAVRETVALQFEQYYPGLGWFESRCQPTHSGLAVSFSDVTSRKETESALHRSEEQYRTLLELAPDAVLVHQDGCLVYANAAALRFFGGHGVEDLVGREILDVVTPEDRATISCDLRRVLESGVTLERREARLVRLDGQKIVGETSAARVDWLGQPAVQMIVRDVSERKQAEAKLVESEARFRGYAENSKDVIWIADADLQHLQYLNPAFEQIWGRSPEGVTPREWLESIHAEDRERVLGSLREADQGAFPCVEYRIVRPDGSSRCISDFGFIIRDDKAQVRSVGGIARDITEHRQAEEMLRYQAQLLDLTQDAIFVRDLEDRITFWSQGAERRYGWPRSEVLGKVTHQLLHTDFPRPLTEIECELRQTGHWEGQLVHRARAGQHLIVASRWALVRDSQGYPCGVIEINNDITESKRAEEAQALLAAIVRHSSEAIMSDTLEGIITSWNAGAEALFGYPAEEVIGRHESLLVPPARRDDLSRDLERVRRGEVVQRKEVELVCKDGRRIVASLAVSPIRDRQGKVAGVAKIVHDVTQLRQAEEALRRSEAIYHAMAQSLPGGAISVVDRNLRYIVVEGALLEQLGLSKDGMVGRTVEETFEPEISQVRVQYFRRALAGEVSSYQTEYRGRMVWSQFVPLPDQDGRVMAAMSLAMDVTERQRAEEALRARSERLRLLSEAAGQLLSGQRTEVTVRMLFGGLAEHMGLDVYFNYHMDDSAQVLRLDSWAGVSEQLARGIGRLELGQAVCGLVAQERQAKVLNNVQQSQDPRARLIQTIGVQVYACFPLLAGDHLVGTLSFGSRQRREFSPEEVEVLRTVSHYVAVAQEQAWHRQHLERTVEQRTAKLQEMVAELSHISYSMVHDMRAPLRAIQGYADLIEHGEGERLTPESRLLLSRVYDAIHHMDELITDVLNYSKAVRSRLPIGAVRLERLLRDLLETHSEFQLPQAEVRLDGEFPLVLANEVGLAQCLAELLRNGVKFVEPGKLPKVRVWAELIPNPGTRVRLWVEDNGTGIPKHGQSRIFNLFQRMHGMEYPGTGVGLALVRKLVERMEGHVGVESEEGVGSRFWIELRLSVGSH